MNDADEEGDQFEQPIDLASQFADIPSDLESSDVELILASGESQAPLTDRLELVGSNAALELMDNEDRQQIESLDYDEAGRHHLGAEPTATTTTAFRGSTSTHSALTQTGFQDYD